MVVRPSNNKMQKLLVSEREMKKKFGNLSGRINDLVADLKIAPTLEVINQMQKYDLHRLHGNYEGKWALKINASNRMLIFSTYGDIQDLTAITDITIHEICIDYH